MGTPRRGRCVMCSKQRVIKSSDLCTTCHASSLDINDADSPGILTGRWVLDPRTRIRRYVGRDVA